MNDLFKNIKAVGFDLDGTLYKIIPEMDRLIVGFAAEKVLEKKPELRTIEEAENFYRKNYKELESGTKTLMLAGYSEEEARNAMKNALKKGEQIDLIPEDQKLVGILKEIKEKNYSYLITKSPKDLAKNKLRKIGIHDNHFDAEFFGDDKIVQGHTKKEAIEEIARLSSIPLEEHVYVGDKIKADILDPKSLGMKTIAVWNKIPEADISIENIDEIGKILL